MKKVILYHQPGGGDCQAAEEFLRQHNIPYEGKDIQADSSAYDELVNKWKSRSTATLVIDGEVIIGFRENRRRVEELVAGVATADPLDVRRALVAMPPERNRSHGGGSYSSEEVSKRPGGWACILPGRAAADVVFEQATSNREMLETQIKQVSENAAFQSWTGYMSALLAQSPKHEIYLILK